MRVKVGAAEPPLVRPGRTPGLPPANPVPIVFRNSLEALRHPEDSGWIPDGFRMDSGWIPDGFRMDSGWIDLRLGSGCYRFTDGTRNDGNASFWVCT
jgi:hypothetical protein